MPAYKNEIHEATDQGIIIRNGWGLESVNDNGSVNLNLIKCVSVFDENGSFAPQYDNTTKETVIADAVIFCIGQSADTNVLTTEESLILNKGLIRTRTGSYSTDIKGLYAGGDIVSGPKSVIDAIGAAKAAAREIDVFLGGDGIISGDSKPEVEFDLQIGKINGFPYFERLNQKLADPSIRRSNIDEVEFCFDDDSAKFETARCLQCNMRMRISQNPYPPEKFLEFNDENIRKVEDAEGVIQLLNSDKEVFLIKGTDNMRETLLAFRSDGKDAEYFVFENDPLFSKRESELVQQYLQKHGEMPDSGDDLDDLF